MIVFTDPIKLYVRESQSHKLSIRVTDSVVDTYALTTDQLSAICESWTDRQGIDLNLDGANWFVQHKKVGTSSEYVRISVWQPGGYCRDYRVGTADMQKLSAQWSAQRPISIPA